MTNAPPDSSQLSGLLYDVQGVFGVPSTYHYQERLQLGPIAEAPDFVAAVCIGEVDEDQRHELSRVLEKVPILRTPGQDGTMWFERALEVLVEKGFCMPEMCAEWVYGQVMEAATEKGMAPDELPTYVRIVRILPSTCVDPWHLLSSRTRRPKQASLEESFRKTTSIPEQRVANRQHVRLQLSHWEGLRTGD